MKILSLGFPSMKYFQVGITQYSGCWRWQKECITTLTSSLGSLSLVWGVYILPLIVSYNCTYTLTCKPSSRLWANGGSKLFCLKHLNGIEHLFKLLLLWIFGISFQLQQQDSSTFSSDGYYLTEWDYNFPFCDHSLHKRMVSVICEKCFCLGVMSFINAAQAWTKRL